MTLHYGGEMGEWGYYNNEVDVYNWCHSDTMSFEVLDKWLCNMNVDGMV